MRALEPRRLLGAIAIGGLLMVGSMLSRELTRIRAASMPRTELPSAGLSRIPGARELAGVLAGVSMELRRFVAAAVFRRIDTYMHEGPVINGGVGLAGNMELVALYRIVTLLDPSNLNAYILAGTHLIEYVDAAEEGVAVLEEGVAANAGDPRGKELLGQIAMHYMKDRSDPARARGYLERVLAIVRKHGAAAEESHYVFRERTVVGMLVVACYRQGDPEAALRYYVQDHNLAPGHPVCVALDHRLTGRGQYRAAPPPAATVVVPSAPSVAEGTTYRPWMDRGREDRWWWKVAGFGLLALALHGPGLLRRG